MKDSFILYTKYEEQISLLSDAQAGILFRALLCYQSEKSLPEMDSMTNLVFTMIRQQIDFDNQKYDDICRARSEAGKLGAEYGKLGGRPSKRAKTPKGDKETAKTAKGVLETPYGFSKTAKTPESESDTDNDTDNRERKKEIDKDIISISACACEEEDEELKSHEDIMREWELSNGLTETMKEFLRHCYINGHVVSNAKLEDILLRLFERFTTDDKAKVDCVTNAIRGGYFDIKA